MNAHGCCCCLCGWWIISGKTSLLEILGGRNSPTRGGLMANGLLYDDHTKMQVGRQGGR